MAKIINGEYLMSSNLKLDFNDSVQYFGLENCTFSYKSSKGLIQDEVNPVRGEFYLIIDNELEGIYVAKVLSDRGDAKVLKGHTSKTSDMTDKIVYVTRSLVSYESAHEYFKIESGIEKTNLFAEYISTQNLIQQNKIAQLEQQNSQVRSNYSVSSQNTNINTGAPPINNGKAPTIDRNAAMQGIMNRLTDVVRNRMNPQQYEAPNKKGMPQPAFDRNGNINPEVYRQITSQNNQQNQQSVPIDYYSNSSSQSQFPQQPVQQNLNEVQNNYKELDRYSYNRGYDDAIDFMIEYLESQKRLSED